jgi:signal transduction histidine kinase
MTHSVSSVGNGISAPLSNSGVANDASADILQTCLKLFPIRSLFPGFLFAIVFSVAAMAQDPKGVLVLHSFGRDYSPFSEFANSLRTHLVSQSNEPLDFYEASIFTARFREPDNERNLAEYLSDLSAKRSIDLIVAIGKPATDFVQRYRQKLFQTTPLLIAGMAARRISEQSLTENDAVVAVSLNFPRYIENILRLRPKTKEIAVVIGNSVLEQFWASEMKRSFEQFSDRVKFLWLNELSLDEMVQRVATLGPQSAIFYFAVWVDAAGVTQPLNRAFAPLRKAATAPMFSFDDLELGSGVVGGPMVQAVAAGQQAAAVALRILKGEKPGEIKMQTFGTGVPIYDWRELRQWGISEDRLPPGSIVRYRESTIWDQYWQQILLAVVVIVVQALLIVGLLRERRSRTLAEVEVRQRAAELALMNRRSVAGQMSASIAHEINQPLAAIVASGGAALRWLNLKTPNLEEVRSSLQHMVSDGHRAAQVVESVRSIFNKDVQRKTTVDVNQLVREVLDLSRSELGRHDITVKNVQTQMLPKILVDRVQFQQVLLNLIRNAIDAMSAVTDRDRVLRIRTERNEAGEIIVVIEDSGNGLDSENAEKIFTPFFTTKPQGMGMGLSICRSIVRAHGGRLSAAPGRSHGAVFEIALPAEGTGG